MGKGFGNRNGKSNKSNKFKLTKFLEELLWATIESQNNPQVLAAWLKVNQHKLNDNLVEDIRQWGEASLPKYKQRNAKLVFGISQCLVNFSAILAKFPLGNQEINLEIALAGCDVAATVFTRERFPQEWGWIQTNLTPIYRKRMRGDRAENLEKALAACQGALQVFTRETFPQEWAGAQNNLGLVYSNRIQGDRAENQEKAIACYKAALQVYTSQNLGQEVARVQYNLGIAYSRRMRGNVAENQEKAIACYEAALLIRTRQAFPDKWAQTQHSLGLTYTQRILGNKIENVEQAIVCYQAALQVFNFETSPRECQMVQHDLTNAYRYRYELLENGEEVYFILQVFYAIRTHLQNTQDNQQAFAPLLLANLENLNENFLQMFKTWATIKLYTLERLEAEMLAAEIQVFSQLIMEFNQGNQAINQEIAITGFQIVATVFNRQVAPEVWASIQNNLAVAYQRRIRGDGAENWELAIDCCQQALRVDTRELSPYQWAGLQNNLANSYNKRIRGSVADNLEAAIDCLELALQVYTRADYSSEWARTQQNLGDVYLHRIEGDRGENLEKAIAAIEASLQVLTKEAFPREWANSQNTLGAICRERIRGDRAENLEKAINCHKAALEVFTREAFPSDWAQEQMNLANAYRDRINGNPAENLEIAISSYQLALQIYTKDGFPQEWAKTQNNLGIAYTYYWQHSDTAEHQERAIAAYEAALQVHTKEAFPREWAMITKNLGIIYSQRMRGNRAENLAAAMNAYQAASEVLTRDDFPELWARNQFNQAVVYYSQEQISEAIACCRSALELYQATTFPVECFQTASILGNAAFSVKSWTEAIEGYSIAIEAAETSRTWATSESRRQEILAQAIHIYANMVQACIHTGQLEKAIEYAERSKSKRLVDLMASNDLYSGGEISLDLKELLQRFDDLQQQIDRDRSQNSSGNNRELIEVSNSTLSRAALKASNDKITALEAQKQQIWEQLRRLDPVLAGEIKVDSPNFAAIQELIDQPTTALLSFYITDDHTYIFIRRQNQITLHACPEQGKKILLPWILENWLLPYLPREGETKEQKAERNANWNSSMSDFLAELGALLHINDLIARHLHGIDELILVPHLYLHLIPFAALPIPDATHAYLGDKFLIRYTPSCQVLEFCKNRGKIEVNPTYGTIEDATDDLPCARFEGEQIAQMFNIPESQRLTGRRQATRENYRQLAERVQVLHSCHHAESRLDNPLESVLKLGDGSITLGQLMTPGWRLPNLSDVFLSCCETGVGLPSLTDDILTLSTGFLCAGSRSVVNTLWAVDDLATALFSILYYQLRQQGKSPSAALQQAQIKLRETKKDELKEISKLAEAGRKEARSKRNQYQHGSAEYLQWDGEYRKYAGVTEQIHRIKNSPEELPFAHPRFWAAFTCSGLR